MWSGGGAATASTHTPFFFSWLSLLVSQCFPPPPTQFALFFFFFRPFLRFSCFDLARQLPLTTSLFHCYFPLSISPLRLSLSISLPFSLNAFLFFVTCSSSAIGKPIFGSTVVQWTSCTENDGYFPVALARYPPLDLEIEQICEKSQQNSALAPGTANKYRV